MWPRYDLHHDSHECITSILIKTICLCMKVTPYFDGEQNRNIASLVRYLEGMDPAFAHVLDERWYLIVFRFYVFWFCGSHMPTTTKARRFPSWQPSQRYPIKTIYALTWMPLTFSQIFSLMLLLFMVNPEHGFQDHTSDCWCQCSTSGRTQNHGITSIFFKCSSLSILCLFSGFSFLLMFLMASTRTPLKLKDKTRRQVLFHILSNCMADYGKGTR